MKNNFESPKHVRRCHHCLGVTEQTELVVTQCQVCRKFVAPFYFFNEVETASYTDNELRPPLPSPAELGDQKLPLRGFTVFW